MLRVKKKKKTALDVHNLVSTKSTVVAATSKEVALLYKKPSSPRAGRISVSFLHMQREREEGERARRWFQ